MEDLLILIGLYILFIIIVFYCECVVRRTKPKNNVHFYVARDMDGKLYIYLGKPHRGDTEFYGNVDEKVFVLTNNFKRLGVNKNDYKNLHWKDEPVEVFVNMED